jgi:hypothetical protein
VAVRVAPALAKALKVTEPFPLPVAPDVIDAHDTLVLAVQRHPARVDTLIGVPAPPAAPML